MQGFYCMKSFVPKEVAICSLENDQIAHFVLNPPVNTYPDAKSQNYLELYHHGINWDSGFVPYEYLQNILTDIIKYDDKVACKGLEKCRFIAKLLNKHIYDMDLMGCPKLSTLKTPEVKCLFHNGLYFHCSLQNIHVLKLWMLQQKL